MTMTDGLPNAHQVGFPLQYFLNPALNRAYDHFWANDVGPSGRRLWDDDAEILSYVTARLAGQPGLLGYEIMNEPWPGTRWPTCVSDAGCPDFDRGPYSAYHAQAIAAVRAEDPENLIWYEPVTTFNQGVPTAIVPPDDPQLGFSFHDYPLCGAAAEAATEITRRTPLTGSEGDVPAGVVPCTTRQTMDNALAHSAATGSALLQTEFGATTDEARLLPQLAEYDATMMPWMFWSYTRYITAYNAGETAVLPATDENVNHEMLGLLARPYPQLVSGTPLAWHFAPASKRFELSFSRDRADGHGTFAPGAETVVSVPALQYPDGYVASVTGGQVVSAPDAPLLRVRALPGDGPLTVTVAPPGPGPAANSACPEAATPLGGGVSVDTSRAQGDGGVVVACVDGTDVDDGTVTAGTGEASAGSVIVDGETTNPGPAAGYLGLSRQHWLTLVGCDEGDYDPNAPDDYSPSAEPHFNNAMASLGMGPLTAPAGPIGPTSPCSPQPWGPGPSGPCGGYQDPDAPPPAAQYPTGSPLYLYTSGDGALDPGSYGYVGLAGDFGANEGASGYLQVTHDPGLAGDVATGGYSAGGGGTVAAGNDGREAHDTFTPPGSPVVVCQN